MSAGYPMVLRVSVTHDVKAVRVAEYLVAAARRFNESDPTFQDGRRAESAAAALEVREPRPAEPAVRAWQDSNLRPLAPEASALSTELQAQSTAA